MTLSLDSLTSGGGFSGPPVKRSVKWAVNGEMREDEVYVRRLSYHSVMSDISTVRAGSDVGASRIAQCICDERGAPIFTVHDVTGIDADGNPIMTKDADGNDVERGALCESLTHALFELVAEVNSLGKSKAKKR